MTPERMAALHAEALTTPRPWSAIEIRGILAGPGSFAVTQAGGFLIGRAIAGEAELLTVVTAPESRRIGIARHLLQCFEEEARARRATDAFLEVAEDNVAARALYSSAGYHQVGRRRGYYEHPDGSRVAALILVKSLDTPVALP